VRLSIQCVDVGQPSRWVTEVADSSAWAASRNRVPRDAARDHAPGAYNGASANSHVWKHDRARADEHVIFNVDPVGVSSTRHRFVSAGNPVDRMEVDIGTCCNTLTDGNEIRGAQHSSTEARIRANLEAGHSRAWLERLWVSKPPALCLPAGKRWQGGRHLDPRVGRHRNYRTAVKSHSAANRRPFELAEPGDRGQVPQPISYRPGLRRSHFMERIDHVQVGRTRSGPERANHMSDELERH
jgi:hypothetical protein